METLLRVESRDIEIPDPGAIVREKRVPGTLGKKGRFELIEGLEIKIQLTFRRHSVDDSSTIRRHGQWCVG